MPLTTKRDHKGAAAQTTLTGGITAGSASCVIASATGWPDGSDGPFYAIIDPDVSGKEEKVLIDSRTGTTLTFNASGRGADDTTATAHDANAVVWHVGPVALEAEEWSAHGASTVEHGATGAVVGTTNVQVLSSKTLDSSCTISDYTNKTHTHAATATGGLLPTAAPAASAIGDSAVTGTAATYSRTDHVHAREAAAAAGASAVGDSASAGAAATVARSDHRHSREAFGSPAASAVADSASDGAATTVARSDHRHAREAFGAVTAHTLGDSSANGSATTVARSDHSHGYPRPVSMTRCTTDTPNSSNVTYVSPTGFSPMTLTASKTYRFFMSVTHDSAATTTGIDIRLTFSGTVTRAQTQVWGGESATTERNAGIVGASPHSYAFISADTTSNPLQLLGMFEMGGSGGTLTFEFRSEVNTSAITVEAGTWMTLEEVTVV